MRFVPGSKTVKEFYYVPYAIRESYVADNVSNCTIQESPGEKVDNTRELVYLILYGMMIPLGVIGNGLTIKYFRFSPRWEQAGTKLLVVLAVNDLISSIYVPLEKMYDHYNKIVDNPFWTLGMPMCYLMHSVTEMFFVATSWLLVIIAYERFRLENE